MASSSPEETTPKPTPTTTRKKFSRYSPSSPVSSKHSFYKAPKTLSVFLAAAAATSASTTSLATDHRLNHYHRGQTLSAPADVDERTFMDRDSSSRDGQGTDGDRYARALADVQSQSSRSSAYKRLKWKFRSKSGGVRFEEDAEKDQRQKSKKHFNLVDSDSKVHASDSSFKTSNHAHCQYPPLSKANGATSDPPCASSFGTIVRRSIMIPAITVDCGVVSGAGPGGHLSSSLSNSSLNLSQSDEKLAGRGPSHRSRKSFSRRLSRSYLLHRNSRSEQFLDWLTDSMENLVFGNRRNAMVEEQLTSFTGLKDRIRKIQQEKAMACVPAFPIETSRFPAYVQERRKKPVLYKGELLMIKKSVENHRMDYAKMKEFEIKNHYPEVLPFDYNRVPLSIQDNDPFSHYINASYVDSCNQPKAYVVAQSTKTKEGCVDFWRMVWESNANCIAMLTKIFDFMKVMCIQYWPMTSCTYGQVHVETLDTKTYAYFIIRTFQICRAYQDGSPMPGATKRIVKHFHFTEWEANALPYVTALLDYRRRIRAYLRSPAGATKSPMIVHCSNGGARSGIFLALDANLELVRAEGLVDIFGYCKTLINARQELIGKIEQYKFMYELLAEGVSCSLHALPTTELKNRGALYTTKKSRQEMEARQAEEYRLLCIWSPPLKIGDCAGGHRLENRSKNRDVMVVPPDYARPYLSTLHGESKDYTYINAFYVDGFTTKNEWIITEWPKHQTVDSFWTLIFDHFCFAVVNLTNSQGKSKPFPPYVHNKGQQNYGPFVIEVIYHKNFPNMTLHTVKIMKKSLSLHDMLGLSSIKHNIFEADARICHLIQVKTWPLDSKVPLSTASLIYLLKIVRELRHQASLDKTEHKPIIVMSHNGISRCGIFVAAHICIDQMEMDDEVDIFRACKSVRMNRPQLIDTKEEFKYLHDLILHYANLYDEYKRNSSAMPIRDEAYKHLFGTNNFT